MTAREQRIRKRDKLIDWGSYAILGGMLSIAIAKLDSHGMILSSIQTWARIVAIKTGIPFQ